MLGARHSEKYPNATVAATNNTASPTSAESLIARWANALRQAKARIAVTQIIPPANVPRNPNLAKSTWTLVRSSSSCSSSFRISGSTAGRPGDHHAQHAPECQLEVEDHLSLPYDLYLLRHPTNPKNRRKNTLQGSHNRAAAVTSHVPTAP